MSVKKKVLLVLFAFLPVSLLFGQQMPFNPISYRIFNPFLLNPAIAGSKDFFSVDLMAGFKGKATSQLVSGNTRLIKKLPSYLLSPRTYDFTNIGVGAALFNDLDELTQTNGGSVTLSYHFTLNKQSLSFLSIGATTKGIYHRYEGDSDLSIPSKKFIFPNVDAGVYFYSPSAYAGVSVTNLLDCPADSDEVTTYYIPASRQYNLMAGYKFVIDEALNLVIEPSIMLITDDSLSFNIKESLQPVLKVYAGNFCVGTYFNDYNKVSFFFQYRYPKFYVGTFFALPKDSPFYKKSLTAEIALGINFSRNPSGYTKNGHW